MSAPINDRDREQQIATQRLATFLIQTRTRSGLTQTQIAALMGTTQTAIARLESGRQSPSIGTLQSYARANGYCLEIGMIGGDNADPRTGCVFVLENRP